MEAEPTILDMIEVANKAITGQGDKNADTIRGSDYESLTGPAAIIWTRQDRRDDDLFKATKLHTAQGDDLTNLVKQRYGIDRYLDSNGQGYASLTRDSGALTAGTVWKGTRISAIGNGGKTYRVTRDVAVEVGTPQVTVPVEATFPGPGSRISAIATELSLDDILWDTAWYADSLECDDGTVFESAPALIARVRKTRLDRRVGQVTAIENACKAPRRR